MGAITPGVRLHDLPQGTVEERIRMAGELGFSCVQLPSKVLYASMGIDRGGLTRELADHLRAVLDEAGVSVAVLGCYKNLATPDRQQLMDNYAEYEACLNFAQMLGGCPVGTETGRPNAQNRVADDRMTDEALDAFADGLAHVCDRAEAVGGQILIEPGWNETERNVVFSLLLRSSLAASGQDMERLISRIPSNSSICLGYSLHVLHRLSLPKTIYISQRLFSFRNEHRLSLDWRKVPRSQLTERSIIFR